MSRELSDLEYIILKVKPKHFPTIWHGGTQRDPEERVVCRCKTEQYPYPDEVKNGTFNYFDHLLTVLDEELHFLN